MYVQSEVNGAQQEPQQAQQAQQEPHQAQQEPHQAQQAQQEPQQAQQAQQAQQEPHQAQQEPQQAQQAQESKRKRESDEYNSISQQRKRIRQELLKALNDCEDIKDEISHLSESLIPMRAEHTDRVNKYNKLLTQYNSINFSTGNPIGRSVVQPIGQSVVQPIGRPIDQTYKPVYYTGHVKPALKPGETAVYVEESQYAKMVRGITEQQQQQRRMREFSIAPFTQPIPQRTQSIPQGLNSSLASNLACLDSPFPINALQYNQPIRPIRPIQPIQPIQPVQPIQQNQRYLTIDEIDKILFEK
jgi:hypothetical protein